MLCCILYMSEKINFCMQPFDRFWRWEEEMKGRDGLKKRQPPPPPCHGSMKKIMHLQVIAEKPRLFQVLVISSLTFPGTFFSFGLR